MAQEGVWHTVDSDGHAMAVWEKSPDQPRGVILLLHGRTWSGVPDFDLQVPGEDLSLMDGLVERGWSTFALDLRGYGRTSRDETGWTSPDRRHRAASPPGLVQRFDGFSVDRAEAPGTGFLAGAVRLPDRAGTGDPGRRKPG